MRAGILRFGSIQEIGSKDTVDHTLGILPDLAFPHDDHMPTVGLEQSDVASVPLHVTGELPLPELTVVLRHREVAHGTAVPEAAVDEDGDPPARIADVGPPRDLPLETVSGIPRLTEHPAQLQLRFGVLADVPPHRPDRVLIQGHGRTAVTNGLPLHVTVISDGLFHRIPGPSGETVIIRVRRSVIG